MSRTPTEPPAEPPAAAPARAVAVAVPACDEADGIAACLGALDTAAARVRGPVTVVVLVNNSRDDTAARARAVLPRHAAIDVVEVDLPPTCAHAGGARRAALDRAATYLPADGVLLTTDADSRVDADWIAANLAEIAAGADAVAGVVTFDEATFAALPPLPLRALEWRLAERHARLASLLDPVAHDPWPNHLWAWGASLAVTLAAYRTIGGLPAVPLAEDRALAAAIEAHDLRLRHSHAPVVYTSARLHGRAPGGFADLLRGYAGDHAMVCDATLEPTAAVVRRLTLRAALRRGFARYAAAGFGRAWATLEAEAPDLVRHRLVPADLAAEVAAAEALITRLERAARRGDTRRSAPRGPAQPTAQRPETRSPPPRRSADSRASAPASGPA